MPRMIDVAPLAPPHAEAAARLHIAGQPGTFLTSLGPGVLTALYAALPVSPAAFGFAALERKADAGDRVVGFVSATTGVGRLFVELGMCRARRFLPPLCEAFRRQPVLLSRSLQTALYPLMGGSQAHSAAELLSIMVEPALRGRGIGTDLLSALVAECCRRRITGLDVTVAAENTGAERFYRRHGFVFVKRFSLYGRPMHLYRRALEDRADESAAVEAQERP